jgi:hypothetical protein
LRRIYIWLEKVKFENSSKGTFSNEKCTYKRILYQNHFYYTSRSSKYKFNSYSILFEGKPANIQSFIFENASVMVEIQMENGVSRLIHPSEMESQLIESKIDGKLNFQKPLNYILM